MATPMLETDAEGNHRHFSVGAVIERDGKYLVIERRSPPPGWAGPAGHIDAGETAEQAVVREVKEEVGLTVTQATLLFEELLDWNTCSKGVERHYWYVFRCETTGHAWRNLIETRKMRWCTPAELAALDLEEAWAYWFEKLGLISGADS